jgi:hypothetical protein
MTDVGSWGYSDGCKSVLDCYEAFLSLAGMERNIGLMAHGQAIRERMQTWTGITVCVGISTTKTLAKLANHAAKAYPATSGVVDLTGIISSFDIDSWVHGHMHNAADYTVHGTRVVCDPYGYPGTLEPEDFWLTVDY